MKFKKVALITTGLMTLSLILSGCGSKSDNQTTKVDYPVKPIKIIHYHPAGTPPDGAARKLASIIEQKYGWKIDVVNVPQNNGADAVNQVWNAPHDGYTVLGQTENMLGFSVAGFTQKTAKDWDFYEMYQEMTAFVVKGDSPYKSIQEIVDAAKAKPETIKVGALSGLGSSFDLKISVLEKVTGAKFTHVPYYPQDIMNALAKNDIDAVILPAAITKQGIEDGSLRVLTITDNNSFDYGGKTGLVNSIVNTYPEYKKYLPIDAVPGLAFPSDVPKEIKDKLGKAFEDAMNSPEMDDYITHIGAVKINLWGKDVKDYMSKMESNFVWVTKDMGLAKVDPATLGIQKPQ